MRKNKWDASLRHSIQRDAHDMAHGRLTNAQIKAKVEQADREKVAIRKHYMGLLEDALDNIAVARAIC